MITPDDVSGLVLAGGQGRRMQQSGQTSAEKGLLELHGRPLVSWAVDALPTALHTVYISANRCQDRYAEYGLVVPDDPSMGMYSGPLAGIASGMRRMSTPWLYVVPADVPCPPTLLFDRLLEHVNAHACSLAYAHADQPQPLFMLVHLNLLDSLQRYVRQEFRQVQGWQHDHGMAVQFDPDIEGFFNINTPDDMRRAHQIISARDA